MSDSFSNIKVGDIVAVYIDQQPMRRKAVTRLTDTQFTTDDGCKFRRADGRKVGGSRFYKGHAERWNGRHDEILRQQHLEREHVRRCAELAAINWRKIPRDKVREAHAALATLGLL